MVVVSKQEGTGDLSPAAESPGSLRRRNLAWVPADCEEGAGAPSSPGTGWNLSVSRMGTERVRKPRRAPFLTGVGSLTVPATELKLLYLGSGNFGGRSGRAGRQSFN